ncbi:heme peroxidase [Xylariales sp. PMI_506]|nr:heme peroxidase [Xylariales sp. PMI_506]
MAPLINPLIWGLTALNLVIRPTQGYTWPDPQTDFLESLLYEQIGIPSNSPGAVVGPCPGVNFGEGRNTAAEWLRTAYHDMATADIMAGTGGIDASIAFEVNRSENVGSAFNETLGSLLQFMSSRSSMSDLIAMAATMAVGSCSSGTVSIPYRAGRIDATAPGPSGVPTPDEDLATHTQIFERQGFNATEMIGLVACGHTLGGVHGVDFPQIVPITDDSPGDDNTQNFDATTNTFDNSVAVQFVSNVSQNPLAFGSNVTTRSDQRIFTSDGGEVIGNMAASNDFFLNTCSSLLERMLNTVPVTVNLSEPILPLEVKPISLYGAVNSNGTITLSGQLRLIDAFSPIPGRTVNVYLRPNSGESCSDAETCLTALAVADQSSWTTMLYGTTANIFKRYYFSATVPISLGVSAFDVEIVDSDATNMETNGGNGFPFNDAILPQLDTSCTTTVDTGSFLNLTVAVRDDASFDSIQLIIPEAVATNPLVFDIEYRTLDMTEIGKISGSNYTLYNAVHTSPTGRYIHTYDVIAKNGTTSSEITFNMWSDLPDC